MLNPLALLTAAAVALAGSVATAQPAADPAPPAAAAPALLTADQAYLLAVGSCIAQQAGAPFTERLTPEQLLMPEPGDETAAHLARTHGPALRVPTDSGKVYRVIEPDRCEAWGFDIDPAALFDQVTRFVAAEPYRGASMMREPMRIDGKVAMGLMVGDYLVTTVYEEGSRDSFTSVRSTRIPTRRTA